MVAARWLFCTVLLTACTQRSESASADRAQPANAMMLANAAGAVAEETSKAKQAPDLLRARVGTCHMGECSWSIEQSRSTVEQRDGARLVRVVLLGGTSKHADNNYPTFAGDAKIEWNKEPHEIFVLCSKRLPSVMVNFGGAWQTDVLDFVNGPPGVQESSAELYVNTCHTGQTWTNASFASRNGYTAMDEIPEIAITNPNQIFDYIPM